MGVVITPAYAPPPHLPTEMLHLQKEVYSYHYLSQGGCSYILTMDDSKQFHATIVSVRMMLFMEVVQLAQHMNTLPLSLPNTAHIVHAHKQTTSSRVLLQHVQTFLSYFFCMRKVLYETSVMLFLCALSLSAIVAAFLVYI